ncbi:Fic family protein [Sphingomonas alpina]|uniref:Fic family protein n=2 Tax=Sphingomonas alpina TaxID=653931 RepID=A0A7H0LLZ9_9SPHN|nr:Fic family protein [Sphingomonas alpina]QNQ10702.1 Fic family protein [Sphingomonas alpina]
MDQKVQYHLEVEKKLPPNRKVFNRRIQEPVLSGYWNSLKKFDFTPESSAFFVSLLCGKEVSLRTQGMRAFDDKNNKTIFEDYDPSQSWMNKIIDIRLKGYDPVTEGIICYTIVIFAHPFLDGNGRFARSVFYGALARHGILRSPCLGMGAGFTLHIARIAKAATQLSQSGDWVPYLRELTSIIEDCCSYAFFIRCAELRP